MKEAPYTLVSLRRRKSLTSLQILQLTATRLIEAVRPIMLTMLFGSIPVCM